MISFAGRVLRTERRRFFLLAFLFFINAIVLESNEVVATSGFISTIGVPQIVVVWAIDMSIIILTSGIYSLFVDRTQRGRLAVILYILFAVVYLALYGVFSSGITNTAYGILLVITDQQWLLFPLVIWALANDMFSLSEAKRLFPLLGMAAFTGGILGNLLAATIIRVLAANFQLLILNAGLIAAAGLVLLFTLRTIPVSNRRSREGERVLDSLREGIGFVKDVPIFRFLTLAMILLGVGLNAIEFDFLYKVSTTFTSTADIQTFYGVFKVAVAVALLLLQGFVASWLLTKLGFRHIFVSLPTAMLSGLSLALLFPSLLGVVIGNYLVRVTKLGIDEASLRAFQGLVPDERRGRVSAFMDGYLYPFGSILSCFLVGATMLAVGAGLITFDVARAIYLGIAIFAALIALISASRIALEYDTSMLNWRLKRRRRDSASSLEQAGPTRRRSTELLDALIESPPSETLVPAVAPAGDPLPNAPTSTDAGIDSLLAGLPRRNRGTPPPGPD